MRHLIAAALALITPAIANAGEPVEYAIGNDAYEGYFAPATREAKGLVLVIHDWDGLTDYEVTRAEMLADEGYDAFAVDLYGKGNRPQSVEARKAEIGKLYNDRETMRTRILVGLETARSASQSDEAVVMGYCFGGAAVLELARSNAATDIAGYASFHGGLKTPEGQSYSSQTAPILIAHGGADAGIPITDAAELATKLETAGVPYQLEVYSGAPHAWTVFGSDRYRQLADELSWDAFLDFTARNLGDDVQE